MRQLKDIATEILERKFSGEIHRMAHALDLGEMDVRRIVGKDPGSGRNQQKIFELTLKLLPLCEELGIAAQELKNGRSQAERLLDESTGRKISGTQPQGKAKNKKGTVSHLPARRDPGKSSRRD